MTMHSGYELQLQFSQQQSMLTRIVTRVARWHTPDPKNLQSISSKPFFKHYQAGINLSIENRLEQSNDEFSKSLQEIKNSRENHFSHFSYILRRIADNHRRMGRMKATEEKLYEIVKLKREQNVSPAQLYQDYDIIYRHMITYDLEKAAKLCKTLLLKQKNDMPLLHAKIFNLNLANAYLLAGNYVDAKTRYSKLLQMDPQGKLKAYALNNLGLTFWWQKNPLESKRQIEDNNIMQNIENDFKQSKQLLARSVQVAENQQKNKSQLQKLYLKQSLNFKTRQLNEKIQFDSPNSIFGLNNLAEFYLANDPLQKVEILYWLKKSMALASKCKKITHYDRTLVQNSILTNNTEGLEENLRNLIQKYRYSQRFSEQSYYCHILGKLLDAKNPKQAKQFSQRAKTIKGILPEWSYKLRYVAMDELDLTA